MTPDFYHLRLALANQNKSENVLALAKMSVFQISLSRIFLIPT